mmetsp:Transcript_69568/g.148813  ORF Transcript_69568/g.148813 Transcript_69568/m.148813 type:complete len:344 (+) Transcript_69568:774-1805(+)
MVDAHAVEAGIKRSPCRVVATPGHGIADRSHQVAVHRPILDGLLAPIIIEVCGVDTDAEVAIPSLLGGGIESLQKGRGGAIVAGASDGGVHRPLHKARPVGICGIEALAGPWVGQFLAPEAVVVEHGRVEPLRWVRPGPRGMLRGEARGRVVLHPALKGVAPSPGCSRSGVVCLPGILGARRRRLIKPLRLLGPGVLVGRLVTEVEAELYSALRVLVQVGAVAILMVGGLHLREVAEPARTLGLLRCGCCPAMLSCWPKLRLGLRKREGRCRGRASAEAQRPHLARSGESHRRDHIILALRSTTRREHWQQHHHQQKGHAVSTRAQSHGERHAPQECRSRSGA